MKVKNLVQHGNSKALIIDNAILQSAGLDENAFFQITVDSCTGITIQSVKPVNSNFDEAKKHVYKNYAKLFKKLSDR